METAIQYGISTAFVAAIVMGMMWLVIRMLESLERKSSRSSPLASVSSPEGTDEESPPSVDSLEYWKAKAINEERRRGEVILAIKIIETERNSWKELYLRCGGEHGVAQEMMLREIGHLNVLLKQNGIKYGSNMLIAKVADEFRQAHLGSAEKTSRRISETEPLQPNPLDEPAAGQAESKRG